MATVVQMRRGTSAEHETFTGLAGEITVDTSKNAIVVHDGGTAGGTPLSTETIATTIPQNSKTSSYTLTATDTGKHINITTGGVTVPASIFSAGDVVTIFNDSTSSQQITQGASVNLVSAASVNTGNRQLAGNGICTILCVGTNKFVISGVGLS